MNEVDLSIDLAGVHLNNPIIAASGTFGYGEEFERFADLRRIGGICVKGTSWRPIIVKLSPNVTDITELARSAEAGGADALTVANTFLGMAIDTDTYRPRIHTITGGLSGPAIRPITLRMVYQCCHAVNIPVIGLGGITKTED